MNAFRKVFLFFILTFLLSLLPLAHAEEPSSFERVIQTIIIASSEGAVFEELQKQLPLRKGDLLSAHKLKESMKILYQIGEFSNIVVSTEDAPNGILLKFILLKKLRVGAIHWQGNKSFSNRRLEEASRLKIDAELAQGWEEEVEKKLRSFYQKEGYFNVKINISSRPFDIPSRLLIHFVVNEGNQSTLNEIYFTGDTGLNQSVLLEALRIHAGFYYSKDSIQTYINDLSPLYLRKRFLKAKIKEPVVHLQPLDKVDLEIPVEAGPQIFVFLSLHGSRHYLNSTLLKQIVIDEEKNVDESILEESAKRLIDFYQNEGYPFVEVKTDLQELAKGKVIKNFFHITEGPRVLLKDVVFKGNISLPDILLRNSISHQKTGHWLPQYIRTPAIQNDSQALVEVYRTNGFLFTGVKETVLYSEDRKTGVIELDISEGVRTLIRDVQFDGFSSSYLPDIQKIVQTQKNRYYYTGTILQDKIAISAYYHKMGYADVTVEATAAFSEKKDLADIHFKVDEGSLIKVGHIRLTGNEYTRPNVILREIDFKPGDIYQEELVLKSQRRIARLGYFQSVRILAVNPDEEDVERDLEIRIKERNAGAFEFGAGYADLERFNGFAELSHKNIAGTGRRASLRAEVSQIGEREIANYTEPWIFNLPLDARSSVYYESIFKPYVNYTQKTLGGSVGIEKTVRDYYKLSLLYQYENFRFVDVPLNAQLAPEDANQANIASLNPSVIRDTRDDFLNPKNGSLNAIWLRWAAKFMGSETQEVKLSLQSSWFYSLRPNMIMAFSSKGGIAYNFGETLTVPISERFMMGGRSTVRGYAENTLGTVGQTIDAVTLLPVGGESMVLFNWELRFNFPESLGIVFFFDSGNVWQYYNSIWSSSLKSSVGPGLRYNTPVGPVRVDLGFKLNREEGESASEFHFTLGHAF